MRSRALFSTLAGTAGFALALAAPLPASAHVELDATSTVPGQMSVLTFAVGHGCAGSATTALTIGFPAEVPTVTPTVKPGWDIAEEKTDAGTTVTYTAQTPLDDGLRDTVEVSALLPLDGRPGDVLAFPTLQTCVEGSTDWSEVADGGTEPQHPAPTLTLSAAETLTASAAETEQAAAPAEEPVDRTARFLGAGALLAAVVAVVVLTVTLRRTSGARG
ncbi:YcnI family copper-binding membrane protein [Herbiconiux sp. SYSU D00978]|uniref:YcnI family copper-binding membrane protein n=1 Tax=Herbiconiux sp. SYSU D00978 TaxID=2812562 RepID=UPI001A96DF3D|nr:YcnI family protein [Herbiconiux sp. SYSU D00978]